MKNKIVRESKEDFFGAEAGQVSESANLFPEHIISHMKIAGDIIVEEVEESLKHNIEEYGQHDAENECIVSQNICLGNCSYDDGYCEYDHDSLGGQMLELIDQVKTAPLLIKILFMPLVNFLLIVGLAAQFPVICVSISVVVVEVIAITIFDLTLNSSFPFVTFAKGWNDLSFGEMTIVLVLGGLTVLCLLITAACNAATTRIEFRQEQD